MAVETVADLPIAQDNPFLTFLTEYGPNAGEEGPVRFVREVLGGEPDPWQEKVLREYGKGTRLISIRSLHGPGKTTVAAWCATHSATCRFPQRTVCTAPTSGQLFDALFAEIVIWFSRLPTAVQSLFDVKSDRIVLLSAKDESYIAARTARAENPEAIQGVHSAHVLLLVDEASGVPEPIFAAGAGSMSGENATTMLLSNPTRLSGTFYESQTRLKGLWWTMHVRPEDSPPPDPARGRTWGVSLQYLSDMKARYGENSNQYRVRCLGEFPYSEDNTLIEESLVIAARDRDVVVPKAGGVWGLDVARFGPDRSVLVDRNGAAGMREPPTVWLHLDTMAVVDKVKAKWDATPGPERPVEILVDVIGVGAGVVDRLRQFGLPVIGVNVSELPAIHLTNEANPEERFLNLRAQLWWLAKEWFEARTGKIMDTEDGELLKELTLVTYSFTPQTNKVKVASKAEMKKAIGRSPDLADAFVLTFASSITGMLGSAPRSDWSKALKRDFKGVV